MSNTTDNWISVEDRLPERKGKYLTCRHDVSEHFILTYKIRECFYLPLKKANGEKKFTYLNNGIQVFDATHWQPLPEPPKQRGNDE